MHSWLWLIAILGFAITASWFVYKNQFTQKPKHRYTLTALRATALSLLLFALLQPLIKFSKTIEQKPSILLYIDKSKSAAISTKTATKYISQLKEKATKFNILSFGFAQQVSDINDSFSDNNTFLNLVNEHINSLAKDNNVQAAIVISDGISTNAISPQYTQTQVPIYTLGLGNTSPQPDVAVQTLVLNRSLYLGNETVLETTISANQCAGKTIQVSLLQGNSLIQQKTFTPNSNSDNAIYQFTLKPNQIGKLAYTIKTTNIADERNKANNQKTAVLSVENNQKNIEIIGHAPHPDIGALKAALSTEKTYKIESKPILTSINPQHIYIIHGMAQTMAQKNQLQNLFNSQAPFWCIASSNANISVFNAFSPQFQIQQRGTASNTAAAAVNNNFNTFFVEPTTLNTVAKFPPLTCANAGFTNGAQFSSLFKQRIGTVNTDYPLWGFLEHNNKRSAWLMGEGIWRWRLANYKLNKTWAQTDELIIKTVQYLSSATVKNGFITYPSSHNYNQNQTINLLAEYTDQTGQKVNNLTVTGKIEGPNGYKQTINFSQYQNAYIANMGNLPAGQYIYTATHGTQTDKNMFVVQTTNPETENTQANHTLLQEWASNSGGTFSTNYTQLLANLTNQIKPQNQLSQTNKTESLLQYWPYLALLVLLYSVEWFLRKYWGSY